MFIDDKIHKIFRIEDANSLISLERWIRDNTDLYDEKTKIENEHLKIIVNYLSKQLERSKMINKSDWITALNILMSRLEDDKY